MINATDIQLGVFKTQMQKVYNALRGEVSPSDFHIVLFLLYLHKEGLLIELKGLPQIERKSRYNELVEGNLLEHNEGLEDLYDIVYLDVIDRITNAGFYHLTEALLEIDVLELSKNYTTYFDLFLDFISEINGKYNGQFSTPIEISRFAFSLVNLSENATIYNPFAGAATYSTFLTDSQRYYGQEINLFAYSIGILRLFAHNKWSRSSIDNSDSLFNWNPAYVDRIEGRLNRTGEKLKYDLVIANPPFALKIQDHITGKFGQIRNAESFLIEKGIESLNDNGKVVAIISMGRLFSSGSELDLRRALINDDILEMVVSFPGGLLKNTGIPFAILVINKRKTLIGKVKFVDASNFIGLNSRNSFDFKSENLLNLINSNKESDDLRIIDNEEVIANDYNLSVNRYFPIYAEGSSLGELGHIVRGIRSLNNTKGKFVRIRDLQEDELNFNLTITEIEDVSLPPHVRCINQSCLLVASRFNKLKPTYYEYKGIPIYISADIIPFAVNEERVDIAYLIQKLHSSNAQKQLKIFLTGGVSPMLRKDDFLRIVIEIPSLENQVESIIKQKEQVKGAVDAYFKSRQNELDLQKKLQGYKEDATREFQSIKHTFRQFLSPLKSNVSGTRKFLIKNHLQPISLDMIFSKNLNQTFEEHLKSMEETIDGLSRLLDNDITSTNSETLNLLDLVLNAQRRFKNENVFLFDDINFDKASFEDVEINEEIPPLINMNKDDFDILFSNVVANAVNHGFKGLDKQNRIAISITYENEFCKLLISNNGNPMPADFTLNDLTTRGEKTSDSEGLGTGGADIKIIVEKYNGVFNLNNFGEEKYPVIYIFKFPLIKLNVNEN